MFDDSTTDDIFRATWKGMQVDDIAQMITGYRGDKGPIGPTGIRIEVFCYWCPIFFSFLFFFFPNHAYEFFPGLPNTPLWNFRVCHQNTLLIIQMTP